VHDPVAAGKDSIRKPMSLTPRAAELAGPGARAGSEDDRCGKQRCEYDSR